MQRIDPKRVEAMVAASLEPAEAEPAGRNVPFDNDAPLLAEPLAETIAFDEFARVDLRVARVISAEDVPGAKKLLKLTLGPGRPEPPHRLGRHQGGLQARGTGRPAGDLRRQSGPAENKFGLSEGMIVAAGGGGEIYLWPPTPAPNRDTGSTDLTAEDAEDAEEGTGDKQGVGKGKGGVELGDQPDQRTNC